MFLLSNRNKPEKKKKKNNLRNRDLYLISQVGRAARFVTITFEVNEIV